MNSIYSFSSPEETAIVRDNQDGSVTVFGVPTGEDITNIWREYINSGEVAAPYVAPPEPPPLTTEQKIAAAGFDEGELEDFLVAKIQLRLNE